MDQAGTALLQYRRKEAADGGGQRHLSCSFSPPPPPATQHTLRLIASSSSFCFLAFISRGRKKRGFPRTTSGKKWTCLHQRPSPSASREIFRHLLLLLSVVSRDLLRKLSQSRDKRATNNNWNNNFRVQMNADIYPNILSGLAEIFTFSRRSSTSKLAGRERESEAKTEFPEE